MLFVTIGFIAVAFDHPSERDESNRIVCNETKRNETKQNKTNYHLTLHFLGNRRHVEFHHDGVDLLLHYRELAERRLAHPGLGAVSAKALSFLELSHDVVDLFFVASHSDALGVAVFHEGPDREGMKAEALIGVDGPELSVGAPLFGLAQGAEAVLSQLDILLAHFEGGASATENLAAAGHVDRLNIIWILNQDPNHNHDPNHDHNHDPDRDVDPDHDPVAFFSWHST